MTGEAAKRGRMLVGLLACLERSMAADERAFPAVDHLMHPSSHPDDSELARVLGEVRAHGSAALCDHVDEWERAERRFRSAVERLTEMHAREDEPGGGDREHLAERIRAVRDARASLERLAEELRACVAAEIDR